LQLADQKFSPLDKLRKSLHALKQRQCAFPASAASTGVIDWQRPESNRAQFAESARAKRVRFSPPERSRDFFPSAAAATTSVPLRTGADSSCVGAH